MARDKRREERICAVLPVDLGSAQGVTRDVSASGVFFETSSSLEIGSSIDFSVEFDSPNGKMVLNCSGNIVRRESREGRIGVAVKVMESKMVVGPLASISRSRSAARG